MTEKKAEMKRDGTMQVTAKEGVRFLKEAGENTLLALQGLDRDAVSGPHGKPRMKRDSTMAVTAKEGQRFLAGSATVTSEVQKDETLKKGECATKGNQSPAKPKLTKFTTMLQTKKEGEAFLSNKAGLDKGDLKDKDEPVSKKLKFINEKEDPKKPKTKRVNTLIKTAKEGEELLKGMGHKDDNPDSERRRTRSQTRGGSVSSPSEKREKKKDSAKNAPSNGGKRGRKGRPKKEGKKLDEAAEDSKSPDEEDATEEDDAKDEVEVEEEEDAPVKKEGVAESAKEESKTNDMEKETQETEN